MDEQRYLINGRIFAAHDPGLQEALARVHGTPARPRCLCTAEGVEMYVSKFSDFVIKRMPETGAEHRPTCPSYELPASESGLGEVLGEAIIERGQEGVELRLDFPLTRRVGRSFAAIDPKPPGEVTVARKRLSMRGPVALPLGAGGLQSLVSADAGQALVLGAAQVFAPGKRGGHDQGVAPRRTHFHSRTILAQPDGRDRAAPR